MTTSVQQVRKAEIYQNKVIVTDKFLYKGIVSKLSHSSMQEIETFRFR
jgi:hypothetical protein